MLPVERCAHTACPPGEPLGRRPSRCNLAHPGHRRPCPPAAGRRGFDFCSLSAGDRTSNTPAFIREAASEALGPRGHPLWPAAVNRLRQAIAKQAQRGEGTPQRRSRLLSQWGQAGPSTTSSRCCGTGWMSCCCQPPYWLKLPGKWPSWPVPRCGGLPTEAVHGFRPCPARLGGGDHPSQQAARANSPSNPRMVMNRAELEAPIAAAVCCGAYPQVAVSLRISHTALRSLSGQTSTASAAVAPDLQHPLVCVG